MAFSKPIRALGALTALLLVFLLFELYRSPSTVKRLVGSDDKVPETTNDPLNDSPYSILPRSTLSSADVE